MIQTTYDRGVAAGELKALREVIVQLASPRCGYGIQRRMMPAHAG